MTKSALLTALRENHQAFLNTFLTISEAQFLACPPDKWTAGQHLEHILRAVNPLALAVRLPKFVLKMMFGKSNRPSKTYEGLVEKYQITLQNGGKAMGRYIPHKVSYKQKQGLTAALSYALNRLEKSLAKFNEEDLDNYILPHPLLGKLTLREMLYFTAYHVTHHHKIVLNQL